MSDARIPPLLASPQALRAAFEQGLTQLLDSDSLNLFILVAANTSLDPHLFARLRALLETRYRALAERLRRVLQGGGRVAEADDDLLVFLKIAAIGFDALVPAETRQAGIWEVQFNHLRSFRPVRNSQRAMHSIQAPFDAAGFNFNMPFIQEEALGSGELSGTRFDLYYNKYPFVELHSLLVPERDACLPQFLRRDMHAFAWRLVAQLSTCLPGIRIGYNALGAFASVNHLHFQLCARERGFPVESAGWEHNGGRRRYPVECRVYADCDQAWSAIETLHRRNLAYNLLYAPQGMYLMVRAMQGGFPLAAWSSGFSWYEMSGGMITFNRDDFRVLDEAAVSADLARARLP